MQAKRCGALDTAQARSESSEATKCIIVSLLNASIINRDQYLAVGLSTRTSDNPDAISYAIKMLSSLHFLSLGWVRSLALSGGTEVSDRYTRIFYYLIANAC